MIVGNIVTGIIAVIIGYLFGSIPAAYIVTRLATGKDIRKLGGGNVGARNVFVEVGLGAGIAVGIFDVGKGAAAVAIAWWLLGAPPANLSGLIFVLAAGVAVVAGHMWPIYLKFTGGNGLATAIGVLSILMTRELLIALAMTVLLRVITRNLVLSVNTSLISVLLSVWFVETQPELRVTLFVFSLVLLLMLLLHFVPDIKAALVKAGSRENFFAELLRRKRVKKEKR